MRPAHELQAPTRGTTLRLMLPEVFVSCRVWSQRSCQIVEVLSHFGEYANLPDDHRAFRLAGHHGRELDKAGSGGPVWASWH
jgi:hypothetical protein